MTEYLYALSNPEMPGLLKVGRTTIDVRKRAAELSSATGVPWPFCVEMIWAVADGEYAERDVHAILAKKRISFDREFFRCDLEEVAAAASIAVRVDESRLAQSVQFADWLMARLDLQEMPQLISWLEGCKPKDVIAALRREAA